MTYLVFTIILGMMLLIQMRASKTLDSKRESYAWTALNYIITWMSFIMMLIILVVEIWR